MTNLIGGISKRGCVYYVFSRIIMIRGWFFPLVYDDIELYNKDKLLGKCKLYLDSPDVYNNIRHEEARNCRFLLESEIDIPLENLELKLVVKKDGKVIKVINSIGVELSQCIMEIDDNSNIIVGRHLENNTSILFKGKNNVLFCEDIVTLSDSVLNFWGNNSLIYLGGGEQL